MLENFGQDVSNLLLDTATWPCQVEECKVISEQSLLTGWLAIWIVNLVSMFDHGVDLGLELFRTHSVGCRAASLAASFGVLF